MLLHKFFNRRNDASGVARDNNPRRHTLSDNGAGGDNRSGANFNAAQNDCLHADKALVMNDGPAFQGNAVKRAAAAEFVNEKPGGGIVTEDGAVSQNTFITDFYGISQRHECSVDVTVSSDPNACLPVARD